MIVRISKVRYESALHAEVTARMTKASGTLVPAIRQMQGCLGYCVGTDELSCTLVNVSTWDSIESAQAMAALPEMTELAREFIALGVEFDRPIVNYPTLWQISSKQSLS